MSQTKVSYKRHLAKTISYRIISTTIGFVGMWWVSGSIKIGAAFGVAELIYKPIQYYIHERIWYKFIKFGISDDKIKKVKKTVEPEQITKQEQTKKTKRLNYSSNR
jgi:uncharacterized membrane protein